jgi:hypothetical protein
MNSRNKPRQVFQEESPASIPQTPPPNIGMGHPEYHFVQGLLKIEGSLGELRASLDHLTKTVDSTKSKVDALIEWKNKILGGAILLGVIGTLLGVLITKFSSYVTIKAPETSQVSQPSVVTSVPLQAPTASGNSGT